jgi:dihydroorotate dehydrogenase
MKMTQFQFGGAFNGKACYLRIHLGLAGGVDKNAENVLDWWRLGCGFLEIGTVTPLPQGPNPMPILARNIEKQSLWNRMGFPNHGVQEVYYNLKSYAPSFRTPVFVNVGKNRTTKNDNAIDDYLACLRQFESLAQVFVLNISSPNTVGLRDLQKPEQLKKLIGPLKQELESKNNQPLLVKLSPDQTDEELYQTVITCQQLGVDGFILNKHHHLSGNDSRLSKGRRCFRLTT